MFNFVKQFIRGYRLSRDIIKKGEEIKERHNTTIEEAGVPRTREGLESYFGKEDGREMYRATRIGDALIMGQIQPRGTFRAGFELGVLLNYGNYQDSVYTSPRRKALIRGFLSQDMTARSGFADGFRRAYRQHRAKPDRRTI